jgi:hypothetical protein
VKSGIEDIFSDSGVVVPPQLPKAAVGVKPPSSSQGASIIDEILSVGAPIDVAAVDREQTRKRKMFNALTVSRQGMLYDNEDVEVQYTHDYRVADVRATITLINKKAAPLSRLVVQVESATSSLLLQTRDYPHEVLPSGSVTIDVAARSFAPYAHPPDLRISYVLPGRQTVGALQLTLPLVTYRFVEPYKLDDVEKFKSLWTNTPCGDLTYNDLQMVRSSESGSLPLDLPDPADLEALLRKKFMLYPLRASASTVFALGAHATQPSASAQFTPVLVRAEIRDKSGFGLAVRNPSAVLQKEMFDAIKRELSGSS